MHSMSPTEDKSHPEEMSEMNNKTNHSIAKHQNKVLLMGRQKKQNKTKVSQQHRNVIGILPDFRVNSEVLRFHQRLFSCLTKM